MGVGGSEVSFTQAASLELQSLKTFSAKKLLWTGWGCKCLMIVTQWHAHLSANVSNGRLTKTSHGKEEAFSDCWTTT
jgi:hypothetical protein